MQNFKYPLKSMLRLLLHLAAHNTHLKLDRSISCNALSLSLLQHFGTYFQEVSDFPTQSHPLKQHSSPTFSNIALIAVRVCVCVHAWVHVCVRVCA